MSNDLNLKNNNQNVNNNPNGVKVQNGNTNSNATEVNNDVGLSETESNGNNTLNGNTTQNADALNVQTNANNLSANSITNGNQSNSVTNNQGGGRANTVGVGSGGTNQLGSKVISASKMAKKGAKFWALVVGVPALVLSLVVSVILVVALQQTNTKLAEVTLKTYMISGATETQISSNNYSFELTEQNTDVYTSSINQTLLVNSKIKFEYLIQNTSDSNISYTVSTSGLTLTNCGLFVETSQNLLEINQTYSQTLNKNSSVTLTFYLCISDVNSNCLCSGNLQLIINVA